MNTKKDSSKSELFKIIDGEDQRTIWLAGMNEHNENVNNTISFTVEVLYGDNEAGSTKIKLKDLHVDSVKNIDKNHLEITGYSGSPNSNEKGIKDAARKFRARYCPKEHLGTISFTTF